MTMQQVSLYTDGGCRGNPGLGGWGCILLYKQKRQEWSGSEAKTTNNRMELQAVIEGLQRLNRPCLVNLYSDSTYVCRGINEWLDDWHKKGWKGNQKKAIKNVDLWQQIHHLCQRHQVTCHWLKGHAGEPLNERADQLVNQAMDAHTPTTE